MSSMSDVGEKDDGYVRQKSMNLLEIFRVKPEVTEGRFSVIEYEKQASRTIRCELEKGVKTRWLTHIHNVGLSQFTGLKY